MKRTDSNNKEEKRFRDKSGDPFLKPEDQRSDQANMHREYLGMEVPKGYFLHSKQSILDSLPGGQKKKGSILQLRKNWAYPLAASILLLISVSIWFFNEPKTGHPENVEATVTRSLYDPENSQDLLLTSLLVEEDEIDSFVDEVVLNEIVVKAELSEQQLENIFINSLIEEDSTADEYLEENLFKEIVL